MENHVDLDTTKKTRAKSLLDLPNEILLKIFSFVDFYSEERIMGYIPDEPALSPSDEALREDFYACHAFLGDIALTCKRFAALVPEVQLHAVAISTPDPNSAPWLGRMNIFGLMCHLQARPELRRYLKQLRVCIPGKFNLPPMILRRELERVLSLPLPAAWRKECCYGLADAPGYTSFTILLAMLSELEVLCVANLSSPVVSFEWASKLLEMSFEPPFLRSLRYLKIETEEAPTIRWLGLFQQLHTLDLSMRLREKDTDEIISSAQTFSSIARKEKFDNIKHLRLDFEARRIGVWDHAKLNCMTGVVQGFQNLESLTYYAEASAAKNPYRSVPAFPFDQANIQDYPEVSSSTRRDPGNFWDRAIYNARTRVTDYQYLVDGLAHLRPCLRRLQLPGGFWTLPGADRKPLPRFDQFTRLEKLIVPQAALVSIKLENMYGGDLVEGDFELAALQALPVSLQHLEIFDVDETFLEGQWLQGLFSEQKNHARWPSLQTLEILIGPMFTPGRAEELEALDQRAADGRQMVVEALLARRRCEAFWAMVDEAAFKVLVGREDDKYDEWNWGY